MNRKNVIRHAVSLFILSIGFILCRYILFSIHGMRQWPVLLFAAGVIVLLPSFFAKAKVLPLVTALAYTVAFAVGVIFQTDGTDPGGGSTNNLWIIWTITFLCVIVIASAAEWLVCKKKK